MNKLVNRFYEMVDKIGKHNVMLILFIFVVFLVTGLYSTFSIFTTSEGPEIIDGLTTYKFILGSNMSTTVNVAANTTKTFDITVSNAEDIPLKYGIYYSSTNNLTDVSVHYLATSKYKSIDVMGANSDGRVTIQINNNSSNTVAISFGLVFGLENGGDLTLGVGQSWIYAKATDYMTRLYNNGSKKSVHIGGDSANPIVSLNASQGIMMDNNGEYRYYGANPNNYVEFNDELWRIISVSNVKSSSTDTVGSLRMKIIRNESIGEYSWDSSVNDWTTSALMTELNELYYNQGTGTCYNGANSSVDCDFSTIGLLTSARGQIDIALYNLGGPGNGFSNAVYDAERGTNVFGTRPVLMYGILGIMYPSDYGYATDLEICTSTLSSYNNEACTSNNWLYDDSLDNWTISPLSSNPSYAIYIHVNGNLAVSSVSDPKKIYPVAYLKPDINIISGEGTEDSPYILG